MIHVPDHVLHEEFADETIVVNMKRGRYFAVKGDSAKLWSAFAAGANAAEFTPEITLIDPTALKQFTNLLLQEGLLVGGEVPAEEKSPEEWLAGTVLENSIERFTDAEGLLLLDPIHDVDDTGWPHKKS